MSNTLVCTSKLACMGNKIVRFGNMGLFTIKKYSPEILTVVGVAAVVTGTVMACKATLKAKQILEDHQEMMNAIDEAKNLHVEDYGEDQVKQDKVLTFVNTGKSFALLYGPSVGVMGLGLACLIGSSVILKKRNLAIGAAYALIEKSFNQYRNRVISELGAEKDFHFKYGTEYETVTEEITDETGKKKKVKKQVQVLKNDSGTSMYARIFEEQVYDTENGGYTGSSQWSPNGDYNMTNLVLKNGWANENLRAKGFLFLNDVYEELGFPKTKAGQMVGWKWQGDGDNYVSFGPEVDAVLNKMPGYLAYRDGKSILLDFNVDGVILDEIE
jgi:hypothetical protein